MKRMMKGFTLVEIMIVVAIIAILAAVAIPNFVKYRKNSQANACISNLKQIATAKEQIYMKGETPGDANMFGASGLIKVKPTCPGKKDAFYELGDETTDPSCTGGFASDSEYPHKMPTASTST